MSAFPFRSAVVTGASSGIGETIARALAADGVNVHAVARRSDRLEALADRFGTVTPMAADLTAADGLAAVVDLVDSGGVELVVNNAGFGTNGDFHELDPDRLTNEIDLNVGALTRLSRAAVGAMVPAGRGWLLNVSSMAGFQPAPRLAVYAATKAFVTSLTESLHEEAAPHGVHVTVLCPGLTKTEFQRVSNTQRYADRFPSVAWTAPDDVARCGLDAVVANKVIAIPGVQYKAMAAVTDVTPRWILRRASALVQRR